ncbi:MAG: protein usg [Sphingomonadales bacterium]|jgi:uncharacterized protein Usg
MSSANLWDAGYRLCKARIIYRNPDDPKLLETYLWQELDHAPDYPVLKSFLRAWSAYCTSDIESVEVHQCKEVTPEDLEKASISLLIH